MEIEFSSLRRVARESSDASLEISVRPRLAIRGEHTRAPPHAPERVTGHSGGIPGINRGAALI